MPPLTPLPLLTTLLLTPPTAVFAPPEDGDPPPPTLETSAEFEALEQALVDADMNTIRDPAAHVDALRAAIDALGEHPRELVSDAQALEAWTLARLNLARSYQILDRTDEAAEVMDEAIRVGVHDAIVDDSNRDELVPAAMFGPDFNAYYHERLAELEARGRGTLTITCDTDCAVFIDARAHEPGSYSLLLGSHDVRIEDESGEHDDLAQTVELAEADAEVVVAYKTRVPTKPPPPPPEPKRILPLPGEVGLIVAGVAAAAIGGGLLGAGLQSEDVTASDRNAMVGTGVALLAVGGGMLTSGVVVLSVDQVRQGKARGTQATLSWTTRF